MLWVYLVSWWADYLSLLLFLLTYCDCVLFGVWLCLLGVRIALGWLVICVRCDDFFWLGCFGVSINSVVVIVCIWRLCVWYLLFLCLIWLWFMLWLVVYGLVD